VTDKATPHVTAHAIPAVVSVSAGKATPHVAVHAVPAVVSVSAGQVSIRMRTHLWISWARIAMKHEAAAHAARQQAEAGQLGMLEQEADASLEGICAAAFALEALSRELAERGAIPQTTVDGWRQKRKAGQGPSAEDMTLEVLARTFDTRGLYSSWRGELEWLFAMRDSSVHYEGLLFEPPTLHPLGINISPVQAAYSAENTTRAVDLLLGILERCRDKPKPPGRQWSRDMRRAINDLIVRRGQAA
jgi:hypothetical protein